MRILTPNQALEDAVDQEILRERIYWGPTVPVQRPAEVGDRLLISYTAFSEDGLPVDRGLEHVVELGGEGTMPGFEEHLVGVRRGERATFTVAVPPSAGQLQGIDRLTFEVMVLDIGVKVPSELDEWFLQQVKASTVQEYRARVRTMLERKAVQRTAASRTPRRVGTVPARNERCWCGSGAKYKRCHGGL